MNFKQATDALLESVTLEDLAKSLDSSVQSVRQARAAEGSTAHRSPPKDWQAGVKALAHSRVKSLNNLLKALK
jgi:hypothetical protein